MGKLNGNAPADPGMEELLKRHIKQLDAALVKVIADKIEVQQALHAARRQRDRQFKSRWFRIGLRLGFYY